MIQVEIQIVWAWVDCFLVNLNDCRHFGEIVKLSEKIYLAFIITTRNDEGCVNAKTWPFLMSEKLVSGCKTHLLPLKYSTTVESGTLDLRVKCNLKYKEIFLTLANSQPFQKALGKDSKVLINLQSDFLNTFFKYFFVLLKMLWKAGQREIEVYVLRGHSEAISVLLIPQERSPRHPGQ